MQASPHPARPALMRRQSSQSSQSSRQALASPASAEQHPGAAPLRHHVKPRHAKIVLPRNLSSGRNLAKLNRPSHAQPHADDLRKHSRQRSHDGDTEIRLPGSLDESETVVTKPAMRRNMTAYQLPRNTSHGKLKKNLSHGQLTRLSSGRNLVGLASTTQKAPPSPALRGKSKRPRSAEITAADREVHERESELLGQQQKAALQKKVGFAVGSAGDSSEDEDLQMEGSGMQEDEWTEESASASPYSTRQNTANSSRRASVVADKAAEELHFASAGRAQAAARGSGRGSFAQLEPTVSRIEEVPNTLSDDTATAQTGHSQPEQRSDQTAAAAVDFTSTSHRTEPTIHGKTPQRSPLHQAKEHSNPATRQLLGKAHQLPAPALISNISAMDDTHNNRDSPVPSQRSSRSNLGDSTVEQQEDELVSRFVPSCSHPSVGSGPTTALSTPKQTSFHTPPEDGTLGTHHRHERTLTGFSIGPTSPGSTISNSSGTTTPAIGRSRTELRLLQEKAMADLESAANHRPQLPPYVYDRRNESLKSYMNVHALGEGRTGSDVFQGRFRALNTELRVVQKFRDPVAESVSRLRRIQKTQGRRQEKSLQSGGATPSEMAKQLWQMA